MAKRKRSSAATVSATSETPVRLPNGVSHELQCPVKIGKQQARPAKVVANPDLNSNIQDAPEALRASPDADDSPEPEQPRTNGNIKNGLKKTASSANKGTSSAKNASTGKGQGQTFTIKDQAIIDPEADGDDEVGDIEEVQQAASRPPPVNSDYLPLPWKGRLGYACLCTYLRYANPPVFSSRTCRIASIIEQRHPLKDPNMPHHPTKNRPDRDQPADIARGQAYVEALGLANARDIVKMLRWNDKFRIRFFRLSSEMFPFASHDVYGYRLAPFASEALAEAGGVAAKLGHRLTTHPGQFTQLGSPRKEVIKASIRDLDYHNELLSLLKLPPQQDRDAVMVLHMGGVFGDKEATLNRFRENYKHLSPGVKKRLVLENDDVSWSVHDLLPICQELNIPLVLDYHHHNIIHSYEVREGTLDIMSLYDEIRETWTRKGITQKMHYSEPTPQAITGRQRRKHNTRVATLPPCPPDMDLMVEAKDKEQAVFELMRTFKLPGFDRFNDIVPHVRNDENKPAKKAKKATPKKNSKKAVKAEDEDDGDDVELEDIGQPTPLAIPAEEVGLGGPEGRVYWPPGMEEWLRPVKRVVKRKDDDGGGAAKKRKTPVKAEADAVDTTPTTPVPRAKTTPAKQPVGSKAKKAGAKPVLTPSASDEEMSEGVPELYDDDEDDEAERERPAKKRPGARSSGRAKKVNYAED